MPRAKKQRGRPGRGYPPRIDATVDELVEAFFRAPPNAVIEEPKVYRCADCKRTVNYPEILYRDGRCEEHTTRPVIG